MATSGPKSSENCGEPAPNSSLEHGRLLNHDSRADAQDATGSSLSVWLESRERHGVCSQRLTRSLSAGLHNSQRKRPSPPRKPNERSHRRRNSFSACQGDNRGSATTTTKARESRCLGTVVLPSPDGPEPFFLEAIRAWEQTQMDLGGSWRAACLGPLPVPELGALWSALGDFDVVLELYLSLAGAAGRRLEPRLRELCMTWRTRAQKDRHASRGIPAGCGRPTATATATATTGADEGEAAGESAAARRDAEECRGRYPLSARQLKEAARVCYEMEYQVRELVQALKAYSRAARAHRKALAADEREAAVSRLTEEVERWSVECERVARMPLQFVLAEAREDMCEALGLDSARVPGSGSEGEEGCDEPQMSGAIDNLDESEDGRDESVKTIRPRKRIGPCGLKIQMLALRLGRAAQLSNLRLGILPGRVAARLLEWLATKPTEIMDRMRDDDEQAEAGSARARLRELETKIGELIERTSREQPEQLTLLDATGWPGAGPSWHKRTARRLKAKIGYRAVLCMLP